MGAVVRGARFLFVGRLDPESSRAPDWPWAGRVAFPPGETSEEAPQTWFAWVLVSSNNRELGRSRAVFETYRACRESAVRLQVAADRTSAELATDDAHGWYGWLLDLEGETVAVSGRWYQRERESRYSLDKFRSALPLAGMGGGVRQIDGRTVRPVRGGEAGDRGVPLRRVPLQPGPSSAAVSP